MLWLRLILSLALLLGATGWAQAQLKLATGSAPAAAPLSLTTADGTGLRLVKLDAKAIVDGPLAFTELMMVFENPEPRTIEGHFQVVLPEGAAISRFAMEINGAWMEGEVVEKQAARRAYEDALHRRVDPALLEQDVGNSFRARVFPIPARGTKTLIISWSHELKKGGEAYRLPLLGLPEIGELNLTALTASEGGPTVKSSLGDSTQRYQVSKVTKRGFTPDQDWVIFGGEVPEAGDARQSGEYTVARFVLPGAEETESFPGAVILLDTSASRAVAFEERLKSAQALIQALPQIGVEHVKVIAFDQQVRPIFEGAPKDFGEAQVRALLERRALGASNLGAALAAAMATEGKNRRLILISDGMVTAGPTDREGLRTLVKGLAPRGFERMDAIVDTTARDGAMLAGLVTAGLARSGQVVEGRDALESQLKRLHRKGFGDIKLSVSGAEWIWPETVKGAQGGDAVLVYGEVKGGGPLTIELSGGLTHRVQPKVAEAEKPLLERAWVAARIARLEDMATHGDRDLAGALRTQIVTLSTKHRVLSPYTALVVLETEADYRRFNIDRNALSNILTVGATGLEVVQGGRAALAIRAIPPPPPPPRPRRIAPRGEMAKSAPAPRMRARAPSADRAVMPSAAPAMAAPAAEMEPMEMAELAVDVADDADEDADDGGDEDEEAERARRDDAPAPPPEAFGRAEQAPAVARRVAAQQRVRPQTAAERPSRGLTLAAAPDNTSQGREELRQIERGQAALTGPLAEIVKMIEKGQRKEALQKALAWRDQDAVELLALVGLGQAWMATGELDQAARAFGSIIDLYPSRADMRRMAGNWLAKLDAAGLEMARDTYEKAAEQRPDHPSVYHQLAMVLVRLGQHERAFDVLEKGLSARRAHERFPGVDRILHEDLQLVAAVWAAREPARKAQIEQRLQGLGLRIDADETLRFVLTWETDANDVDFHIFDAKYNHAYYSRRGLASGGELYADVTRGYGPECFTIGQAQAYPYRLKAHYYSKGAMGHGAGTVQVIRHDGEGNLGFEERPFVIIQDRAYVDLGEVTAKTAPVQKK